MQISSECFADKEISSFIQSEGKNGNCDLSGLKNVITIDHEELKDFFQELLDQFEEEVDGIPLITIIQEDWNLFSTSAIGSKIINEYLSNGNSSIKNAKTKVTYNQEIRETVDYWDTLKESLKWESRFIADIEMLKELKWDSFFNTQFKLSRRRKLYRARLHHESGNPAYQPDKMMSPPKKIAKGGRANPVGIPYLYLCDNSETVLYEIRASYLDELSIGIFKALNPLKIVDFTEQSSIYNPSEIADTIKSSLLRLKISADLSKPMRRYDSEIEYIPTQFICEYIRIITGAAGIQFQSSVHPIGKNIVVFDATLMECVDVKLVKVSNTKLSSSNI